MAGFGKENLRETKETVMKELYNETHTTWNDREHVKHLLDEENRVSTTTETMWGYLEALADEGYVFGKTSEGGIDDEADLFIAKDPETGQRYLVYYCDCQIITWNLIDPHSCALAHPSPALIHQQLVSAYVISWKNGRSLQDSIDQGFIAWVPEVSEAEQWASFTRARETVNAEMDPCRLEKATQTQELYANLEHEPHEARYMLRENGSPVQYTPMNWEQAHAWLNSREGGTE
jgi:hypothetical protein